MPFKISDLTRGIASYKNAVKPLFTFNIFLSEKKLSWKISKNSPVDQRFQFSVSTMKKSGIFAASIAAASATAIAAPSSSDFFCNSKIHLSREGAVAGKDMDNSDTKRSSSAEKFAPRFDGLRFIETLVTAHR